MGCGGAMTGTASSIAAISAVLVIGVCAGSSRAEDLPQEVAAFDNTKVIRSCRLILPQRPLRDEDNNGVIHIEGDDITVDLDGRMLIGAEPSAPQELLTGIGIRVTGKRVTVRNGFVSGYRVGLEGMQCDGSSFRELGFIRNFAQRLRSTPEAEDQADWLWPHTNDADEWATKYGAAISIRNSTGVTLSRVHVRQGQNGILLSDVKNSRVEDCDASFLSGWGVALWRSSANTLSRNSFDFCIRGYSHDIYSRGQDSAGILCFEQSSGNRFLLNSATHCGDGFFLFAGREALGDSEGATAPSDTRAFVGRGSNDNLIAFNDFSDAAAHGIEVTFSYGNRILFNRLDRAGICGVWGGYSHGLTIRGNTIRGNGVVGAIEGGGVNIEHGSECRIEANRMSDNSVGVSLWWDADEALAAKPWCVANGTASKDNAVVGNSFSDEPVALRLRATTGTVWMGNSLAGVGIAIDADDPSRKSIVESAVVPDPPDDAATIDLRNTLTGPSMPVTIAGSSVVTARPQLSGRAAIVMGEFGPYDYVAPMAVRLPSGTSEHRWRLLGPRTIELVQATHGTADLRTDIDPEKRLAVVTNEQLGGLSPYELEIFWGKLRGESQRVRGTVFNANWRVSLFPLPEGSGSDSIPTREAFDAAAKIGQPVYVESLTFAFGSGGPSAAKLIPTGDAEKVFGTDRFGLRATTQFTLPAGEWTVETMSDDGIRVMLDGTVIIDRWTHHGPTIDRVEVTASAPREAALTVDYFELTGHAVLDLKILPKAAPK